MGEDQGAYERRTTVAEAAEALGISAEAVRGRIRRGTLPVEREEGTVYVLLGPAAAGDARRTYADQPRTTGDRPTDRTELVDALREQISDLRGQLAEANAANRENRRIIAALASRIPELEAPQERQESAEDSGGSESQSADESPQTGTRRPWWRRFFGG